MGRSVTDDTAAVVGTMVGVVAEIARALVTSE
jgi:hypothetical protein